MSCDGFVKFLFRKSKENGYLKVKIYPHTKEYSIDIGQSIYDKIVKLSAEDSKLLTIEKNRVLFFFNNSLSEIKPNKKYYKLTIQQK